NDLNLISGLDDGNNDGFAGKLRVKHDLIKTDSLWNVSAIVDADLIQKNFKTIQRLYYAEFNRDWNLEQPLGNQNLLSAGLQAFHSKKGFASYKFEYLNFSENFNGSRHNATANLILNRWNIFTNSSILNSESNLSSSTFLRSFNRVTYSFKNQWIGTKLAMEDNEQRETATDNFTPLSQRFKSYDVFYGLGDSTKVFAEVGYRYRVNDSLRNNQLTKVNTSNNYYFKSKLIQNERTDLRIFVNYRTLKYTDDTL